jgi:glycosyltransferase involved in cell wall biosynthesis
MESPPSFVEYSIADCRHIFLGLDQSKSPAGNFHTMEAIQFEGAEAYAHSHRLPVLNCSRWVTDTDDLLIPLLCGRHYVNRIFRERLSQGWNAEEMLDSVVRRILNMLAAYSHPSCRAILFRSDHIANATSRWLEGCRLGAVGDQLLAKFRVMYPAVQCPSNDRIREKWQPERHLEVVYCGGDDYERKNASIAIQAFQYLSREFPDATFTYIGAIPPGSAPIWNLSNVRYGKALPRQEVRTIFDRSHILFHPSKWEGLGCVLIEAASAGMAVIVAKGTDMAHTEDLFGSAGGAAFIDRDTVRQHEEPESFIATLRALLADVSRARRLGWYNYEMCAEGQCSLKRRDKALMEAYFGGDELEAQLTMAALPEPDGIPMSLHGEEVIADRTAYCQSHCRDERSFVVNTHDLQQIIRDQVVPRLKR